MGLAQKNTLVHNFHKEMSQRRSFKTNNCLNCFFVTKCGKGELGQNLVFMQRAQLFPWKQLEQLCKRYELVEIRTKE